MPKKNFAAGSVLRAADVNQYLTDSKNVIINGAFDFWQRGTSFTPTNGLIVYTADRFWVYRDTGSAVTVSQQSFTPGTAPSSNIEGTFFYRFAQTTTGSGGTLNYIAQPIENARTFAGQSATISFWAKADASRTVTPVLSRAYGSGGSSEETIYTGSAITLTTSWVRYSVTVSIPSLTGKTIGAGSNITLLWKLANNVVQTVDIWGVQFEEGSVATEFSRNANSIQAELAACQRYYYRAVAENSYGQFGLGIAVNSTQILIYIPFPVQMRTIPSTTLDWTGSTSNYAIYSATGGSITGSPSIPSDGVSSRLSPVSFPVSGVTAGQASGIRANNSTTAYLGFSAEF